MLPYLFVIHSFSIEKTEKGAPGDSFKHKVLVYDKNCPICNSEIGGDPKDLPLKALIFILAPRQDGFSRGRLTLFFLPALTFRLVVLNLCIKFNPRSHFPKIRPCHYKSAPERRPQGKANGTGFSMQGLFHLKHFGVLDKIPNIIIEKGRRE